MNDTGQQTSDSSIIAPPSNVASDPRTMRLNAEWRLAMRAFAYHPFVGFSATRGDPPTQFRVIFRVRSLVFDKAQQLQFASNVAADIVIPPGYPNEPPVVRPQIVLFHPNVSLDAVHFTSNWRSTETLVDVVRRVGELLSWRTYDPDLVVNPVALQWLQDNTSMLPLDPLADFSAEAGGDPLKRIARFGPQTLDQMRKSIDEVIAALTDGPAGPTVDQVRSFARQTQAAMRLFLENDIPVELRRPATEFERLATELPEWVPSSQYIRELKIWSKAALEEAGKLAAQATELTTEINAVSRLVTSDFNSAESALACLPASAELGPFLLRLPPLFKDIARRADALKAQLALPDSRRPPSPQAMEGTVTGGVLDFPGISVAGVADAGRSLSTGVSDPGYKVESHRPGNPSTAVAGQLGSKLKESEEEAQSARHSAEATMAGVQPLLDAARVEILEFRVMCKWREYVDILAKASVTEANLASLGADEIEGYFIDSPDGRYGPFQFEQEVLLGKARIYVAKGDSGTLHVRNAEDESTLGRGVNGTATAMVATGDAPAVLMTITAAVAVEQSLLQLDYAMQQTHELLPKLQAIGKGNARSWCGRMINFFHEDESQQAARSTHRRAIHRWELLAEDLKQVAAFKARLGTYFLVERMTPLVANLVAQRSARQSRLTNASERIKAIVAKSSRDAGGQLVVPAKFANAYAEETAIMKESRKSLERTESRIKSISTRLRERLASPRQCGRPEIPRLRKLQPISEELAQLAIRASDDNLKSTVAGLAAELQTSLMVNLPPAPPPAPRPLPLTTAEFFPSTEKAPLIGEAADPAAAAAAIAKEPPSSPESIGEPAADAGGAGQEFVFLDEASDPAITETAESTENLVAHEDDQAVSEAENDWIEQ